jgi:diguanylate cyclase (GGDEF)-like protein
VISATPEEWSHLLAAIATAVSLPEAARRLAEGFARASQQPVALLSRDAWSWQFEAGGVPPAALVPESAAMAPLPMPAAPDERWTGVALGRLQDREWLLMLPGDSRAWRDASGLDAFVTEMADALDQAARQDDDAYERRFRRRLYGFSRRLASRVGADNLPELVLRTLVAQTRARIGVIAGWVPEDRALAIAATLGYPKAIVEHLRIRPGEGILGTVYATREPLFRRVEDGAQRRLRYGTDSYIAIPILVEGRCVAVIAMTDRADGRPFEPRDFEAARILAAQAAVAFGRDRLQRQLDEFERIATVDAVTGLFNRHYLEGRLQAELQRARRQDQDLALLMIDVDDFKRINDTRGHLVGDRALRDVADLLRGGIRVFDVCARFGGEEFVILMPGAGVDVAGQVAERIRRRVELHAAAPPLSMTISVGIGMLTGDMDAEALVASADRALMAAKMAGKNAVWIDDPEGYPRQRPFTTASEPSTALQPRERPPGSSSTS